MNQASSIQMGSKLAELLEKYHKNNNITRDDRETLINLLNKEITGGAHDVEDKIIMVMLQAVLKANTV
jgi:hypothetical protein